MNTLPSADVFSGINHGFVPGCYTRCRTILQLKWRCHLFHFGCLKNARGPVRLKLTTAEREAKMVPFHNNGVHWLCCRLTPKQSTRTFQKRPTKSFKKRNRRSRLSSFMLFVYHSHCRGLVGKNMFCKKKKIRHISYDMYSTACTTFKLSECLLFILQTLSYNDAYSTCLYQPPFESFDKNFQAFHYLKIDSTKIWRMPS